MSKNGPLNTLKYNCKTKATCHIIFLCIILYKNIFAKFFENHSREIEKNTENVSLPLKKSKFKIVLNKEQHLRKVFQSKTIRVSSRIYVENFIKNKTGPQEREKKYHKTDQKVPLKDLQEKSTCCEKYFQPSKHERNTKNIFTNFYAKAVLQLSIDRETL